MCWTRTSIRVARTEFISRKTPTIGPRPLVALGQRSLMIVGQRGQPDDGYAVSIHSQRLLIVPDRTSNDARCPVRPSYPNRYPNGHGQGRTVADSIGRINRQTHGHGKRRTPSRRSLDQRVEGSSPRRLTAKMPETMREALNGQATLPAVAMRARFPARSPWHRLCAMTPGWTYQRLD